MGEKGNPTAVSTGLLKHLLDYGWSEADAIKAFDAYGDGECGALVRIGSSVLWMDDGRTDYSGEMIACAIEWEKTG